MLSRMFPLKHERIWSRYQALRQEKATRRLLGVGKRSRLSHDWPDPVCAAVGRSKAEAPALLWWRGGGSVAWK
jgi:hypothetical protein